ncbi:MAG: 2-C-methyl-D-erythritol 2,4-cyclodiphosphate synthase [archaeon]
MKFDLIKVGFGYDSHRFLTKEELEKTKGGAIDTGTDYLDANKPLIIGGVRIEGFPPFKARSDGDVLIHAVMNAVLSALGDDKTRDIGTVFPNTDKANTNLSGKDMLLKTKELLEEKGFVVTELKLMKKGSPKFDLGKAKENIASVLGIEKESILIQGTTGEELDDVGRGLGVEVFGICVLMKEKLIEKLNELVK